MAAQRQRPEIKRKRLSPGAPMDRSDVPPATDDIVIPRPPGEARKIAVRSQGEAGAWHLDAKDQALLDSFDGRLAEAHRRMDRILARLNVE